MEGYQGESGLSFSQRKSAFCGSSNHVGRSRAPARVGDRRIHGNHQIELAHEMGCVGEIAEVLMPLPHPIEFQARASADQHLDRTGQGMELNQTQLQ